MIVHINWLELGNPDQCLGYDFNIPFLLHQRLKLIRQHKGLSQDSVAVKAGISVSSYSRIERGEGGGRIKTLRGIAKVLDIPLHHLLNID